MRSRPIGDVHLYLSAGRDRGLANGTAFTISRRGSLVASAVATDVGVSHSVARLVYNLDGVEVLPGDTAVATLP